MVAETLEEARDNAGFASEDAFVGLAVPDGVAAAELDLWRDDLFSYPTDVKVAAGPGTGAGCSGRRTLVSVRSSRPSGAMPPWSRR